MMKRIAIMTLLAAPLAVLAGGQTAPAQADQNADQKPVAGPSVPPTGNTNVNGRLQRSDKKTLKVYCEAQAKKQNLTGAKAKAAIAACEKS